MLHVPRRDLGIAPDDLHYPPSFHATFAVSSVPPTLRGRSLRIPSVPPLGVHHLGTVVATPGMPIDGTSKPPALAGDDLTMLAAHAAAAMRRVAPAGSGGAGGTHADAAGDAGAAAPLPTSTDVPRHAMHVCCTRPGCTGVVRVPGAVVEVLAQVAQVRHEERQGDLSHHVTQGVLVGLPGRMLSYDFQGEFLALWSWACVAPWRRGESPAVTAGYQFRAIVLGTATTPPAPPTPPDPRSAPAQMPPTRWWTRRPSLRQHTRCSDRPQMTGADVAQAGVQVVPRGWVALPEARWLQRTCEPQGQHPPRRPMAPLAQRARVLHAA